MVKLRYCLLVFLLTFLISCDGKKEPIALPTGFFSLQDSILDPLSTTFSSVGDKVIYSSWDTLVNIFDVSVNEFILKYKLKDICYAKPLLDTISKRLFVPFSNREFICLDVNTQDTIWSININGRCGGFELVNDSILVINEKDYGITALNANNGEKVYELRYDSEICIPDLSPYYINSDTKYLYISDWLCKDLITYDLFTGKKLWEFSNKESYALGDVIVIDSLLFIGGNRFYNGGKLWIMNKYDQSIKNEFELNYQPREDPILYDNYIFFYCYKGNEDFGKISVFDINNQTINEVKSLSSPEIRLSGHQMYLAGDYNYYSNSNRKTMQINCKTLEFSVLLEDLYIFYAFEYNGITYLM
ncbi:MAG: hypothetical protein Kapaf2KO_13280 [Candidatus Kapaibacteriales bacterium]